MLRATRDLSPASRFLGGEYEAVAMLLAMQTLDAHVLGLVVAGRQVVDAASGASCIANGRRLR